MLVPVRESLSLLPQLFIAQSLWRQPRRKLFWVYGSIGQALAPLLMVPTDRRNKPCFSAMASRCPPLTPPVIIDQVTEPALPHACQIDPYRALLERN